LLRAAELSVYRDIIALYEVNYHVIKRLKFKTRSHHSIIFSHIIRPRLIRLVAAAANWVASDSVRHGCDQSQAAQSIGSDKMRSDEMRRDM